MASFRPQRAVEGFSLVEVLISIIVLSIGLLGAVGMLMAAMRSTHESGSFTAAVNLIRELSEKARINKRIAARNGPGNAYVISDWKSGDALPGGDPGDGCTGLAATCTPARLAAWDMRGWLSRVYVTLPDARVVVCFDDTPPAEDGSQAWSCSGNGRNLVVKLGWTSRLPTKAEKEEIRTRPPRVVMQIVAGQAYDAFSPDGF